MQSTAPLIDWRQRILFFLGTVAVLFAVAMFSAFTIQWWWWSRDLAFLVVACICTALMKQRLVMVGAIGLVVATRLLFALIVYFLSVKHH